LMMVFYFTVFRKVFGIWFVFILGVWNDALNGNPLGTSSLCYIILIKTFLLINTRILPQEEFQQIWRQFIAFCFSFLLLKWAMLSIFAGNFYSFKTPLIHLILSSVLYVLMHKFFDYLSQKLLRDN
jgi:cell shape-determining protein MreD